MNAHCIQKPSGRDKDKDSFTGLQEFVVGYSKAPEQPQSSARPIYVILTLMHCNEADMISRMYAYVFQLILGSHKYYSACSSLNISPNNKGRTVCPFVEYVFLI